MLSDSPTSQKIVVIDDDPFMRQFVSHTLRKRGYQISEAHNGATGLDLVRNEHPELVISDVRMEGIDGLQALTALRSDPATAAIPFILITAEATPSNMRAGMGLGADDYLPKPFTAADLVQAVEMQGRKRSILKSQSERQLKDLRNSIALALPHELFTPLNGIMGYAELMREMRSQLSPAEVEEMTGAILRSGKRLHNLLQNYVTYTQFELFAIDPEKIAALRREKTEEADAIISQTASGIAENNRRTPDFHLDLRPAAVNMRREHLAKLAEEIISNAFKFSKSGSSVLCASSIESGAYILRITDHGPGMTPAQIASIGAYSQFDRETREQQGLGLGLAIAKRIAGIYGGAFELKSEQGCTVATISIPLAVG